MPDAIWKLVWRTKQTKTNKRNKPHINRVKTVMQARYVTGVYRSKIKWRRQSPASTLSCASHTLREIVMEPNVDIKRLPPALGEITWTGTENPRPHNVMIYHVTEAVSDSKLSQSLLGIYPKIQVLFPLHLMHICQSFHFLSVLDRWNQRGAKFLFRWIPKIGISCRRNTADRKRIPNLAPFHRGFLA